MEVAIDRKLTKGLTYEGTNGTVTVSTENLVTFNASNSGILRRTRWIEVFPGDTIIASVQMKGLTSSIRLYSADAYNTESIISYVQCDSDTELKKYSVSYTVPVNSTAKLIGIGFMANNGIGSFYNPRIMLQQESKQTPNLIACGLVMMTTGDINDNFPSFGVTSATLSSNKITITLSQLFKGANIRPIAFAVDGTPSVYQHGNKLVCSDISYNNGVVTFYLYYVNSSGAIVAPPANSSAQFSVYY